MLLRGRGGRLRIATDTQIRRKPSATQPVSWQTSSLRGTCFDAFGYRGARGETVQLAADYYSCYGKNVGFKKTVTGENARACSDSQEYVGQIVNGLETAAVMAAYHFPEDPLLNELDAAAKARAGVNLIDPIRFGRWKD